MITAYGDIESAVLAMQKGAYLYLEKSDKLLRELELTVDRALQFGTLVNENRRLRTAMKDRYDYIGAGEAMRKIREHVRTVSESRSTVLISGESGTGKELVARSIHYQSRRSNGPFIKINCAALPEGLIESELFGHEKGAFTGALRDRAGKFELASEGTLLLDEVGEMPASMQAKLLRVLQEREISKVGGESPVPVDVRIVATTNRKLEEEVGSGRFREDLFYRLNVFRIHLPPLRERMEDIEALVAHFIKKYNEENGFNVEGVHPECWRILKSSAWPGNIRELENAVERAVVLTRTGLIAAGLFAPSASRPPAGESGGFAFKPGVTIAGAEKELILKTLEHCGQNRTKAAAMLDISIRTLRNKLNEYGCAK
jgi:DNA-binding NtrC family response regulator